MMRLKEGVMRANINGNMFGKIIALGEFKGRIDFLKELEPRNGIVVDSYRETKTEYMSQISTAKKNELIKNCQDMINMLTDILDEFNASTNIDD
jgi:hypothetical protein